MDKSKHTPGPRAPRDIEKTLRKVAEANGRMADLNRELLAALRALEAKCDEGNYVRQNDAARVAARALLARVDGGGQ